MAEQYLSSVDPYSNARYDDDDGVGGGHDDHDDDNHDNDDDNDVITTVLLYTGARCRHHVRPTGSGCNA